jgi:hypothetical protein
MLKAGFRIDQSEQVMDTPIYMSFVCRNDGPRQVSFCIGNGRDNSYRFQAEPEAKLHNPYFEMGGLMAITRVAPQQEITRTILLNRYLQFLSPGRYIVHGELDLETTDEDTRARRLVPVRSVCDLTVVKDDERRRDAWAALEADLMGRDGARQMRAADALAELRSPQLLPVLQRGLESPNSAVIEKMIIGLANVGGNEALDLLRKYRASSPPEPLLLLVDSRLTRMTARLAPA